MLNQNNWQESSDENKKEKVSLNELNETERNCTKKSMILVVYQRCHQFFGRKKCCDKFLKNFKTSAPILI